MCSSFFLLYLDLHVSIFFYKLFAQAMSLLLNLIFRERSLSFRTWSVYLTHIFVSTPSVGVEFLVDLNGSTFLHTPSIGAACVCGVYKTLILGA